MYAFIKHTKLKTVPVHLQTLNSTANRSIIVPPDPATGLKTTYSQ